MNKKTTAYIEQKPDTINLGPISLTEVESLLFRNLFAEVKPYIKKQNDPAHDTDHAKFVVKNALDIANQEGGDRLVLIAAGLLHDIINYPKGHHKAKESAKASAKLAGKILTQEKYTSMFSKAQITLIQDAIMNHSLGDNHPQTYLESKIIQDADNLDKLGWRGIIRTAAYARHKKRLLHHFSDPLGEYGRELQTDKYMLDYFFKLLTIPDKLHTKTARSIAPELMLPIYGLIHGIKQQASLPLLEQRILLTPFSKN